MTSHLPYPSFAFGDGPALADTLLALVLAGKKTATCWSVAEGDKDVAVGKRWTVLDGAGVPRALTETTELTQRRFDDIDGEWARAEGEGDLSLGHWRTVHRAYFDRNGGFAPDMLLWCERFRLIDVPRVTL
jgi:uncharacterized protein YhfF